MIQILAVLFPVAAKTTLHGGVRDAIIDKVKDGGDGGGGEASSLPTLTDGDQG